MAPFDPSQAFPEDPIPERRFALVVGLALFHLVCPTIPAQDVPAPVKARCTVILQTRTDRLYCYATNRPFRVILREPASFAHGEVFEAEGQLSVDGMAESVPTLLDARVRRLGETNLPAPLAVTPRQLEDGRLNFHRVRLVGRVESFEWMKFMDRHVEVVVAEGVDRPFRVNVLHFSDARREFPVGTEVEFIGLSFLETFVTERGPEVQLDVENLAECRVLRPALWLTLEVARRMMVAGATLAIVGGLWLVRERRQNALLRRAERDVRQLNAGLEQRIGERTAELSETNLRLVDEVAARQQAETSLRLALAAERELNELKTRFISMVSHEFRTPLAVIMSSAEILDAYLDRLTPEKRALHLHDIVDCTGRMARMIDEVLLLGRLEAGKMACKPAPVDLVALCRRLVEHVVSATHGRCPIRFEPPAALPPARADEDLLRHILGNLLTNAVKYSPEGCPVEFELAVEGADARFVVRDRGIGIPDADARQLFTAFHRGTNVGSIKGSGLGLVIVKASADLHQGTVTFQSRENQGSTFTVVLPVFGE